MSPLLVVMRAGPTVMLVAGLLEERLVLEVSAIVVNVLVERVGVLVSATWSVVLEERLVMTVSALCAIVLVSTTDFVPVLIVPEILLVVPATR